MNVRPQPEPDSKLSTDSASRLSTAVRWFRHKMAAKSEGTLKEMIEEALEDTMGAISDISADEKSLLKNMINFGELTVKDIMIPRSDIMGVERGVSIEELKQHVITIGHTRIPVYEETLDAVTGFIHVKDLLLHLSSDEPFQLARVMREILFVPPSMRILDLLMKMRISGCHIAIVVDEYGGTDGMVTMEDLFEELVGEIQDEHDGHESEPTMRWLGDHVVECDARVSIARIEEALAEKLTEGASDAVDTLGGLVVSVLGRVPVRGELVMLKPGLKAEILIADPRRIRLVRITRLPHAPV